MTLSSDRPTPRSRPRPAADEGQDPVVPGDAERPTVSGAMARGVEPAAVDSATAIAGRVMLAQSGGGKSTGRRGAEPTVQLNVRVSGDVNDLIDTAAAETGSTKRQLIEHAIRNTYAN